MSLYQHLLYSSILIFSISTVSNGISVGTHTLSIDREAFLGGSGTAQCNHNKFTSGDRTCLSAQLTSWVNNTVFTPKKGACLTAHPDYDQSWTWGRYGHGFNGDQRAFENMITFNNIQVNSSNNVENPHGYCLEYTLEAPSASNTAGWWSHNTGATPNNEPGCKLDVVINIGISDIHSPAFVAASPSIAGGTCADKFGILVQPRSRDGYPAINITLYCKDGSDYCKRLQTQ